MIQMIVYGFGRSSQSWRQRYRRINRKALSWSSMPTGILRRLIWYLIVWFLRLPGHHVRDQNKAAGILATEQVDVYPNHMFLQPLSSMVFWYEALRFMLFLSVLGRDRRWYVLLGLQRDDEEDGDNEWIWTFFCNWLVEADEEGSRVGQLFYNWLMFFQQQ